MSKESQGTSPSDSAPDVLPPVQPPSASFLLQLFLIPMIIVTIIVLVFLAFHWLAQMGSNPRDLARDLKTPNETGWQKAHALSDILRDPGKDYLKDDVELAQDLATVLDGQIEAAKVDGGTDAKSILMRVYLSRALGEFRVPEVLPVLIKAADTERSEKEIDVRDAALQAISVLAQNLAEKAEPVTLAENADLLRVLLAAANESSENQAERNRRAELRSAAAFALGVVGGVQATDKLVRMLDDPYPNARYNAATGLARHGDIRAARVLLEMLDPQNQQVVLGEKSESERQMKRGLVIMNGIRATGQLIRKSPNENVTELKASLQQIADSDLPDVLRIRAREVLDDAA